MKINRNYFVLILILISTNLFALNKISGRVVNEKYEPLMNAQVVLLNPVDSTLQYYDISDKDGNYQILKINDGDYLMQFSYVSKEIVYDKITIPLDKGANFGTKIMKGALTDEVTVTAEYIPMEFKQDTVVFNAKAFKTKTGAVVEDLLKKIPGVEVDQSGNMKALGEDVTKILVDGKEFFGRDPKVATKNLPAKSIDKVEIFDKKSEEAEFTGINDGVQDRTINLLLNENSKEGYFGKGTIGVGTEEHYNTEGKLFRFSAKFQSALLGNFNNINKFGFTGRGHGKGGEGIKGLNTTGAGGINLLLNTKKPNRYFASYLANTTKNNLDQTTQTENFLSNGSYIQNQILDKEGRNTPHKINLGIRHNFNKEHKITFDGNIDINYNNEESNLVITNQKNDTLINNFDNSTNTNSDLIDVDLKSVDIIKLNDGKTQIKTRAAFSYNKSTSNLDWINFISPNYYVAELIVEDQYQDNITDNFNLSLTPTVIQKIKRLWYLSLSMNVGAKEKSLDRKQGINDLNNSVVNFSSSDFKTNDIYVKPTISIRRSAAKSQMNFEFGTNWNQFDKIMSNTSVEKKDYLYLLPGFEYSNNYQSGRRIFIRYNSNVNMPGLTQLLPIANTLNRTSIYQGNLDLSPEYNHNIRVGWSLFDSFSFTSLFTHFNAGYTKDKISTSENINEDFTKLVQPVNVPENYNASLYVNFSTPIRRLGIKVNATSRESWNKGVNIINQKENTQNSLSHTIDLNFENRQKDFVHIRVGGSISLTDSEFSIAKDNQYFNTSYYADLSLTPNEHWDINAEGKVSEYNSQSFDESVSIPSINAGISYHFLEGKKAEVELKAYDLLNKTIGFRRISENNYLMEQEWNTIGRYVILNFSLRIGKK